MTDHKATILIIEDEEILVDVLSKKLEQEGYQVYTAGDGIAGLALVDQVKPDMILLDILMPKMDGYEVLSSLKTKYGSQMPPVMVISNSGQPVELEKVKALGAQDYIIKAQFTPEEVLQKVTGLLGNISAGAQSAPPSAAPQTRILIVEDDQFLRDLLMTKLTKEQFNVTAAIDGPAGLEKILKERPDIVLLDIIMPGMDGFEILKRIRSNSDMQIARTPVILLSNLGQEADVEKGRNLGANDYLIKSNFTIDEIIEKIQKTLSATTT
ncbi:MAG: response regulator [Patescibacteria group bacterium]